MTMPIILRGVRVRITLLATIVTGVAMLVVITSSVVRASSAKNPPDSVL